LFICCNRETDFLFRICSERITDIATFCVISFNFNNLSSSLISLFFHSFNLHVFFSNLTLYLFTPFLFFSFVLYFFHSSSVRPLFHSFLLPYALCLILSSLLFLFNFILLSCTLHFITFILHLFYFFLPYIPYVLSSHIRPFIHCSLCIRSLIHYFFHSYVLHFILPYICTSFISSSLSFSFIYLFPSYITACLCASYISLFCLLLYTHCWSGPVV
jgi:hypothetical protein